MAFGLSVKVRCSGVGGGQEALTAPQEAEIEGKRRVVVEQPTAQSARQQLEQEVAPVHNLESAYQKQYKARATWWQKRATKSRSRSSGCSKRLWRQRWKRPEKPAPVTQAGWRRRGEEGRGRPLAAPGCSLGNGQQQC